MKNNISENAKNSKCSGCGICEIICPTESIDIKLDDNGFYMSNVDDDKCINCGLCVKVCPFEVQYNFENPIKNYVYKRKEENQDLKSSSAGVCWDIAKKALDNGYSACGAKYNYEDNKVEHFIANNEKDYLPAQGSKYLQSRTIQAFKQLLNKKNDEKYIVFGTPCQIAGVRNYIEFYKMEDRFILIDFFCHGIPSYHLWDSYLEYHNIDGLKEVVFRDNTKAWNDFSMNIKTDLKNHRSSSKENDLFYRFFILDFCMCSTCSETCMFFNKNSRADIRFGDLWNKDLHKTNKPMSVGLLYNQKVDWLLEDLGKVQLIEERNLEEVLKGQPLDFRKSYKHTSKVIKSLRNRENLKKLFYIYAYPKLVKGVVKRKLIKLNDKN